MTEEEFSKLVQQLVKYEKNISSYWATFWRGVLSGFGFFIGSAVLAALIILILTKIQGWAYIGHYMGDIIELVKKKP